MNHIFLCLSAANVDAVYGGGTVLIIGLQPAVHHLVLRDPRPHL